MQLFYQVQESIGDEIGKFEIKKKFFLISVSVFRIPISVSGTKLGFGFREI
jgi:hypothetical protein